MTRARILLFCRHMYFNLSSPRIIVARYSVYPPQVNAEATISSRPPTPPVVIYGPRVSGLISRVSPYDWGNHVIQVITTLLK